MPAARSSDPTYDGRPGSALGDAPIPRPFHPRVKVIALALAACLALAASPALAATPERLSEPITDQAGVLNSIDEIEAALAALLDDHDVQLFVLFVDTTEGLTVTEFADETARLSSFGGNDALLVVATEDRSDAIWVADALAITDAEIDGILVGTLEPGLGSGDFSQAVIDTAEALGRAADEDPILPPLPTPRQTLTPGAGPGNDDEGGGFGIGAFLGLILLGTGIAVILVWIVTRLVARRDEEERDRQTGKLARETNAHLIATDERVRSADQEVGFVEAEFGAEEAAPFRQAVAAARTELQAAFEIRQRLDDSQPEDRPTREAMLREINERTARADEALDRQAARIDELRNLERQAPAILAALPAQLEAQEARLQRSESTLQGLVARYADSAVAPVRGNVVEARKGLAGARAAIERGTSGTAGGAGRAASEIVTAQKGIAGATALLDAIDAAARGLAEAEQVVPGQLAEAEQDFAEAGDAVPVDPIPGLPDRDAAFDAAMRALETARAAAAARPSDPLAAARATAEAQRLATELLATVRNDAQQQARFLAALAASITAARAEVDRAAHYIATRRSGMRQTARTRLAEAERLLAEAEALRDADPRRAMAVAQRADRLAEEAYATASHDFAQWDRTGRGATTSGGDLAGAILGGILGGILSGGGRGAGWGGSPWGSSGSGSGGGFGGRGGGGWGGGHSRGGSFGGFGGGGRGGGGGHSRGGRW